MEKDKARDRYRGRETVIEIKRMKRNEFKAVRYFVPFALKRLQALVGM